MNERKVVDPGAMPDNVANPGMPNNPNLVGQPGGPSQGSVKVPTNPAVSATNQTVTTANPVTTNINPQNNPFPTSTTVDTSSTATITTPAPATTAPSSQPAPQHNPVQFSSTNATPKAAQKQDPFAEQNQKAAVEKQQQTKDRNRGLIIGGIILAIIVIIAAAVTFFILRNNSMTTSEKNEETANNLFNEVMDKISASNTASPTGPSSTSISEANVIFEEAISQATQNNNTGEADALRVAQMLFYTNVGTNYSEMLRIGEEVQNIDALEPQQQLQYYNIMANAYYGSGNTEKANEYYNQAGQISNEINGLTPGEGDSGE